MGPEVSLSTVLPRGVVLRDPIVLASGCCGYGEDYAEIADPCTFGGVITKAVSLEPRLGNSGVRLRETPAGLLNCIGLQNPGVDKLVAEILPRLLSKGLGFFINVVGNTCAEFGQLIERLEASLSGMDSGNAAEGRGLLGYELDLSCPNVEKGTQFATDLQLLDETVRLCRGHTDRLVVSKLSPNVTDIRVYAEASRTAGADAVTVANTLNGMSIDIHSRRSHLARVSAGLSGAAVRPAILFHVHRCYSHMPDYPIFASGGITDTDSAVQFVLAGATVLQLGTGLYMNPKLPLEVRDGLVEYLRLNGESTMGAICGGFRA